jgi:succinyl-CoA synthetase beta subunit
VRPEDRASLLATWRASLSVPGRPNEWESKRLLAETGIAVPRGVLIEPGSSPAAPDVPFPWVVKVCSAEVLHKTDRGGVRLGVAGADSVASIKEMRKAFPGSAILVEEMVRSQGVEIIVGALYDPSFGPAVMAGAGGILTELYQDVSFRLAPCSREEALRMLEELTVFPALRGYRGLAADVDALAALVERVAGLATRLIGPGDQLDINPVVWAGERWVALDAKIVLAPA